MQRKATFQHPGFSLYEGRTRGKRTRYTYSDEEGEDDDDDDDASGLSETMLGARRSTRNSGAFTPADPSRSTTTASGRQVRSRMGGVYGESILSGQSTGARVSPTTETYDRSDDSEEPREATRASRRGASNGWSKDRKHIEIYNSVDEMDEEDDASSSGGEWDGGDGEEPEIIFTSRDGDSSEDEDSEPKSLIVKLKLGVPIGTHPGLLSSPPVVEDSTDGAPKNDLAPAAVPPLTTNGFAKTIPSNELLSDVLLNGHNNSAAPSAPVPATALAQGPVMMKATPVQQKNQSILPFAAAILQSVPPAQAAPPQPAPCQQVPVQSNLHSVVQEPTVQQPSTAPINQVQQLSQVVPQQSQKFPAPVSSGW